MKKTFYLAMIAVIVVNAVAFSAPSPAIIQKPGVWTVDVKFEQPGQIMVKVDKSQEPKRFWYTIITLTNNTSEDVDFYPQAELLTNTLTITEAGKDITPNIFNQIKLRHQGKFPFLEPLEGTTNRILQGSDNTKDIAVIFPDFDKKATSIDIFIAGLSNEIAAIDHPSKKDGNGNPEQILLRKTLQLNYILAGDPAFRDSTKLVLKNKTWVMR